MYFFVQLLEQVGMILNEVSRLFPVFPFLLRTTAKDMQLGDIFVPKGITLEIPVHQIHRDPKLWGADALEFNPNRFIEGVSQACHGAHHARNLLWYIISGLKMTEEIRGYHSRSGDGNLPRLTHSGSNSSSTSSS
jgi:hypothetical protein